MHVSDACQNMLVTNKTKLLICSGIAPFTCQYVIVVLELTD